MLCAVVQQVRVSGKSDPHCKSRSTHTERGMPHCEIKNWGNLLISARKSWTWNAKARVTLSTSPSSTQCMKTTNMELGHLFHRQHMNMEVFDYEVAFLALTQAIMDSSGMAASPVSVNDFQDRSSSLEGGWAEENMLQDFPCSPKSRLNRKTAVEAVVTCPPEFLCTHQKA